MSTNKIDFRPDVSELLKAHLAGVDGAKLSDKERWERYRAFRVALHPVCGCGAEANADHAMFIRAIQEFCRGILL